MTAARSYSAFLALLVATSCSTQPALPEIVVIEPQGRAAQDGFLVDFTADVKPLLESQCLPCHNRQSGISALSFERREYLVERNSALQLVLPGEPERSALFLVTVLPSHFFEAMPPEGHRLNKGESWLLYRWILEGAEWPEDEILRPAPGSTRPRDKPLEKNRPAPGII